MRKHFVWVLALALAVGVSSLATGANTQKITMDVKPSSQKKTKYGAGSINVVTLTDDSDGGVDAASRAQLKFDDDIKFTAQGLPTCKESQIQGTTTQQAIQACGKTQVGKGAATAAVGGDPNAPVQTVVTAFNGQPKGGKPVLLLHTRSQALGLTTILVGVLKNASGIYGKELDVSIDPLPFGTALTRFQTKVQKSFRVAGKNRSYVSARCFDNNKTWNYAGKFTFEGYARNATDTQKCQVKS